MANQSRLDAIADAETLLTVACTTADWEVYGMPEVFGGRDAISEINRGNPSKAALKAKWAASAAFRAVPALRG